MSDVATAISVTASGTPAGGVYPEFEVLVDGHEIGTAFTGAHPKAYDFTAELSAGVAHKVQVKYLNDTVIGTEDRNLTVASVTVNGDVHHSTDPGVTYTAPGIGTMPGQALMPWDGTLAFVAPATDFAAAAPTPSPAPAPAPAPAPTPAPSSGSSTGASGSEVIAVTASGTSAGGVEAHFYVTVDGTNVGGATVTTASQAYDFTANLAPGQAHDIQVHYDNDTVIGTEDRNLTVNSITVEGHVVPSTDSHVSYEVAGGQTIAGQALMPWDGTLDFNLPASDFTAGTSTGGSTGSGGTTGSGGSTGTGGSTGITPPALGKAYYVASGGSDSADGLASTSGGGHGPFADLAHAVQAAEAHGIHEIFLGNGDFQLSSTLELSAADSGLTIAAAPGAHPVIDGSAANLSTLIDANGATNLTFDGLSFEHASGYAVVLQNSNGDHIDGNLFSANGTGLRLIGSSNGVVSGNEIDQSAQSGIEVQDGSNSNLFDSNVINGTGGANTQGGGFFMHGVNNNMISHNLVENTTGMGIGVENWDDTTVSVGNSIIDNEVVNTNQGSTDSGAIYTLDRSHVQMQTTISGNVVANYGPAANHTIGIYLDDMTSGVTVTQNIISGSGTDAIQVHGGDHNTITNNVADLGSGGSSGFILFQSDPQFATAADVMQANVISTNIVTSSSSTPHAYDYIDGGAPGISGNLYYDSAGAPWPVDAVQDSHPTYANPQFTNPAAGDYSLSASSPAHALGFHALPNQAGPHPTTDYWHTV